MDKRRFKKKSEPQKKNEDVKKANEGTWKLVAGSTAGGQLTSYYIYGIAGSGKKMVLNSNAIDLTEKVFTLPYRDICAIVSRARYEEYDPTDENVLNQNQVVHEAHTTLRTPVLPSRFSTVARSESDVMKILASGYPKFKEKLESLRGKVEMAVKVYCDVKSLRDTLIASGIRGENRLNEEMRKRSFALASSLLEQLRAISEEDMLNDLVFQDLILNGAFLIKDARAKEFLSRLERFQSKHSKGLRIEWSGPYMPYSFTEPKS